MTGCVVKLEGFATPRKCHLHVTQFVPHLLESSMAFEYLCVDITCKKFTSSFVCFYIPPACATTLESIQTICHCIDMCNSMHSSTFIIGDFNLPYITWSIPVTHGGPSHHFFLNYCQENSLQQHIMEPSIFTGNTQDLLLTNPSSASNIISYTISEPLCSTCDHFMIKIQVTNTSVTHSGPPQLDFKNADYLSIINNPYQCNWHDMVQLCGNNTQLLYDCILHELHLNIHNFVPYTQKPKGKPQSHEIKRRLYLKKCFYKKLKAGQCKKDQY